MTTNIDLLRVMYEQGDSWDHWTKSIVLSAAMPGVPDPVSAYGEVEHLVALIEGLDCRLAVDMLKEQGRIGGGHNPLDAFNTVVGETEAEIHRTVHAMRVSPAVAA